MAGREGEVGRFLPTPNWETTETSLKPSHTEAGETEDITRNKYLPLFWQRLAGLDVYWGAMTRECEWQCDGMMRIWGGEIDLIWKGPVPGLLSLLAGHTEKYPQEVSIILDMFCCPSQLLISWIYIICSSDQAEHYLRSPETFTIFSSQAARSIITGQNLKVF